MKLNKLKLKTEVIAIFLLISSVYLGFYFNEDSSGGAINDYNNQLIIVEAFSNNFNETILNYDKYLTRHSPVLIIFLSFLKNLGFNDEGTRLLHITFCLFLPFLFFKCLKLKFPIVNNKITYFLVGLIFISPYFRSLSIWPDSRILGLTLFVLSIYFFLIFQNKKELKYAIYNTISLALSAYVSPNFSIFVLFFLLFFFRVYSLNKNILIIIITNILLSLPALYYLFVLEVNFLTVEALKYTDEDIGKFNFANKILIISSLIFFYLFPFYITKIDKIYFSEKILSKVCLSTFIFIICLYNFNYSYNLGGGGIFFKISYFIFSNNLLFYIISFISLYCIVSRAFNNYNDSLIWIILVASNIQYSIYHKYYDLLIIFLFLFLLKGNIKFTHMNTKKITFIYFYFMSFLVLSFFKKLIM